MMGFNKPFFLRQEHSNGCFIYIVGFKNYP